MVILHIDQQLPVMKMEVRSKRKKRTEHDLLEEGVDDGLLTVIDLKRGLSEFENDSPKDPSKKKRRKSSKLLNEVKDEEDNLLAGLLDAIKLATASEVKVFTHSPSTEDSEAALNETNPHASFPKLTSYTDILCELVEMFVKLRRFPKLIAKLLCCWRDCIINQKDVQKLGDDFNLELFVPSRFTDTIGPIITSLPIGQMTDLLKTLYHNLLEECIKRICQKNERGVQSYVDFFSIVVHLMCEYLTNIKVVDHSVQLSTIEKVNDMMFKLREECLGTLGSEVIHKLQDPRIIALFLKLSHAYGELHGLLIHYKSDMYKVDLNEAFSSVLPDSSATNLTYLHPYLTSESWKRLSDLVESSDNLNCKTLIVMLVVQKLKYMIILGKRTIHLQGASSTSPELFQAHLNITTEYILSHQEVCQLSLPELYVFVCKYLDESQIIELVKSIVKHGTPTENENLINNSLLDSRFEAIFLMETISFIFTRMSKIKVLPKWCRKTISLELVSGENKIEILKNVKNQKIEVFGSLLSILNVLIEKSITPEIDNDESISENMDFVSDEIIRHKFKILNQLSLEYYPSHLKTMTALSSAIILLITNRHFSEASEIIKSAASIFVESVSVRESKGNPSLFDISWAKLYRWLYSNCDSISSDVSKKALLAILQNIYISATSIHDFEMEGNLIHEEISFEHQTAGIRLQILEFLLHELPISIQAKSKLTNQIQQNIQESTIAVAKALKKSSSHHKSNEIEPHLLSNIFRACWLTQLALPTLSVERPDDSELKKDENYTRKLKRTCCKHVDSAFKLLLSEDKPKASEMKYAKVFALVFLHTVCKTRAEVNDRLPETFIRQVWNVCQAVSSELWIECEKVVPSENTKKLPKDMFEIATREEFAEIKDSILQGVATLMDTDNQEDKVVTLVNILDCLLDSNLTEAEKKDGRREILDSVLCSMVQISCNWSSSTNCLNRIVLPTLRFQVKLLQRRNAICNSNSSATCLSSITNLPLHEIENMKLYGEVFCTAAEILNAFTLHRMDVLSFRMHVYLQCLQFLIESVTSRANQENKLSNDEIVQLKYCAHRVERTCQSMKLNQKEFSKVSPYFVAILMRQFEMFTVYPAVKEPLLSGCYKLLDLCDNHGVAQLNAMLTVGSRETFKSVFELYNKFYKYKGKV